MSTKNIDLTEFKSLAVNIRKKVLEILNAAGSGHPGGSLSSVEILLSLYGYKMKINPNSPDWEGRDFFIMSKGHASAVTYVVLSHFGFFPEEELKTYRKFGSRLQGHVHHKVPGVEFNTGSLGHGLSVANGIAFGAKMLKKSNRVFCLMGDGEIQEGSVWEAAMTASHHKLDNVCAIVDYNKVQENGPTNDIKNLEPLADKWRSFGWHVKEVIGHNFKSIFDALDEAETIKDKPTVLIAHTIKGKGISFMEDNAKWHGKAPNGEQLAEAIKELQENV